MQYTKEMCKEAVNELIDNIFATNPVEFTFRVHADMETMPEFVCEVKGHAYIVHGSGCAFKKEESEVAERVMTQEEFFRKMNEIRVVDGDDEEIAHSKMDGVMCDLLSQLGYGDGIKVFDDQPKWYA